MDGQGLKVSLVNVVTFGRSPSRERFLCTKYIISDLEDRFYGQGYDHNFEKISFRKWIIPLNDEEFEYSKNFDFDKSPCEKYFIRVPRWSYFTKSLIGSNLINSYTELFKILSAQILRDVMPCIFIPLLNLIRLDYHNYKEIIV